MGEVIEFPDGPGKDEDDVYFETLRKKRTELSGEERQEWLRREEAARDRHPSTGRPDKDRDLSKESSSDRIDPDDQ